MKIVFTNRMQNLCGTRIICEAHINQIHISKNSSKAFYNDASISFCKASRKKVIGAAYSLVCSTFKCDVFVQFMDIIGMWNQTMATTKTN